MRIAFFLNRVPDPCGAFFHDVALARVLQSRGHQVMFIICTRQLPARGTYRGIPYVVFEVAEKDLERTDIWCTPHAPAVAIGLVRKLNQKFQKPLVVSMHYGEDTQTVRDAKTDCPEFLWIVSDHIRAKTLEKPISPSFKDVQVFRPIFLESELRLFSAPTLPTGDCITLINANPLKGLGVFLEMARRFPNKKFLGVRPYYNIVNVPTLPNIEWMDLQEDIRNVFAKTRVVLMPSLYESWGRVAFEAMFNGIPVLYTKPIENPSYPTGSTEGLHAWISESAIGCDSRGPEEWVAGITALDSPETYASYSAKAYACTSAMNIFDESAIIESRLKDYVTKYSVARQPELEPSFLVGGMRQRMVSRPSQAQPQAVAPQDMRLRMPASIGRFGRRR